MATPRSDDFDLDEVSDSLIVGLLISEHLSLRQLGFVLLDAKKRAPVCGILRLQSDDAGWQLSGIDIAEIWEATMTAIERKVEEKRFKKAGSLHALVCKIARWRALDFLRQRDGCWIDHDVDLQMIEILRCDDPHKTTDSDFIRVIRFFRAIWFRYKKLSTTERRGMKHDVRLFLADEKYKWPSPSELMAFINRDGRHSLTLFAVRAARARARRKLRGCCDGGSKVNEKESKNDK